jgi:hypothetical protein
LLISALLASSALFAGIVECCSNQVFQHAAFIRRGQWAVVKRSIQYAAFACRTFSPPPDAPST